MPRLFISITPVIAAALVLSALLSGAAHAGQPQRLVARFDVQALGLKVGELSVDATISQDAYSVEARFGATGLVRLFRDMGFVMHAEGRIRDGRFLPALYTEEVDTGRRTSSARMRYEDETPVLVAGRVEDGEVAPLDPAGQAGTVDPLTALLAVLRDQPAADLCRYDRAVFDGGRRSRVRLTGGTRSGDTVTCNGQFLRVAGYPAEDLETRRVVPLTIDYAAGADGRMQARGALLRTVYGPVGLARRD